MVNIEREGVAITLTTKEAEGFIEEWDRLFKKDNIFSNTHKVMWDIYAKLKKCLIVLK